MQKSSSPAKKFRRLSLAGQIASNLREEILLGPEQNRTVFTE